MAADTGGHAPGSHIYNIMEKPSYDLAPCPAHLLIEVPSFLTVISWSAFRVPPQQPNYRVFPSGASFYSHPPIPGGSPPVLPRTSVQHCSLLPVTLNFHLHGWGLWLGGVGGTATAGWPLKYPRVILGCPKVCSFETKSVRQEQWN